MFLYLNKDIDHSIKPQSVNLIKSSHRMVTLCNNYEVTLFPYMNTHTYCQLCTLTSE